MADEQEKSKKTSEIEYNDDLVVTQHERNGLRYTATAGRIVLRDESHTDDKFDGHEAKAEMFLVAYTLDGAEPGSRPVTFAFNGGPGSSSVWLHLGVLGPRRVVMGDAGNLLAPPYGIADNAETLLQHSDIVLIDPISTGFSRAIKGGKSKDFHGFTGDLDSIAELIRLWTSRNNRWMSPKYLCGESYGTLRAAALANHLQEKHGMWLNGLMLISSVLTHSSDRFSDQWYPQFLPTYAAIAHYHGLHGERALSEVLAEAEEYAERGYPWVLERGARLTEEQRTEAVAKLASLTGLSPEYVDRVDLRIEHVRFFTELLRHRKQTVGRLDGRFTGWDSDYGKETWSSDPSFDAIMGPYTAAINHYLRTELNYHSDLPYTILSREAFQQWSYKEFEGKHIDVAAQLAAAMRANPHLRVHVACGYHDGATPYFASEHTFAHLAIPAELRGNVEFRYYEAGHMMYVHEPSRVAQSQHLAEFVQS